MSIIATLFTGDSQWAEWTDWTNWTFYANESSYVILGFNLAQCTKTNRTRIRECNKFVLSGKGQTCSGKKIKCQNGEP